MEAHLAPKQSVQVNKITSSCKIYSGPHDTQYCMENPKQAFVDYASSRTDEAEGLVSNFMASQDARLSKFEADFKQQGEMTNKINTILKAITDRITGALLSDTVKNSKLNVNSTSPVLSACSYREPIEKTETDILFLAQQKSKIAYKMPHKIKQYNSLSDLEKEHTKSVYLKNEECKRREVEYRMSKILRFYKECRDLGPEYLTGVADGGGAFANLESRMMASLLAKRVASNLLRVKTIASSSCFFCCQGYQYVQHDSKGECILKDANEVNQFVESLHEAMDTVNCIIPGKLKLYVVPDDPQAFYFIVVFGDLETCDPYGGYAVELFLEDSFYDIYGIQADFTGDNRKIIIPNKKSAGIETIAGNVICLCENFFINRPCGGLHRITYPTA
nr:MAK10-like protein [Tanacetum cinerariifolium]